MKTQPFLRRSLIALAGALLIGSGPARADTTLVNNGYFNGWSESFGIVSPVATGTFGAGGFYGTWDPGSGPVPIIFWCIELNQYFNPGQSYGNSNYGASQLANSLLSRLFTEVGGSSGALTDAMHSAAFQLAVWDIVYDQGSDLGGVSPDPLHTGSFLVTSGDPAAVWQANYWLTHLPPTGTYDLSEFHSGTNQDFITDSGTPGRQQLPEPSPLPLLGVGLVAMLVTLRRRVRPQPAGARV